MTATARTSDRTFRAACVLVAATVLAAALAYTLRYAVNADNAALLEFARRMLVGGRLGVDYYDTNPPLSIIAYLPAALLMRTGVAGWHALTLYGLGLLALSAGLSFSILKRLGVLTQGQIALFAYSFVLANLLVGSIAFAERDQLVLFGLLPLLLAQHAINEKIALPRVLLYPALIFGALALCLKPHYALAPALLILWRLARERRPSAILRADVIVLAIGAAAYAAMVLLLFPAFGRTILPDVLAFYAGHAAVSTFPRWQEAALAAGILVIAANQFEDKQRRFFVALGLGALGCTLAYIAQWKGYSYHLIPVRCLLFTAACAMAAAEPRLRLPPLAVAAPAAVLLLALFRFYPDYPTHRTYTTLPLAQIVGQECGPRPCPFFVDNDFAFMTYETALYTGSFPASRFPALWFEPALACGQRPDLFEKYSGMLAADLTRWQPMFLALTTAKPMCPGGGDAAFDFGAFYSRNPAFAAAWKDYKFERSVTFNRRDYFRGTDADYDVPMTFMIYKRTGS